MVGVGACRVKRVLRTRAVCHVAKVETTVIRHDTVSCGVTILPRDRVALIDDNRARRKTKVLDRYHPERRTLDICCTGRVTICLSLATDVGNDASDDRDNDYYRHNDPYYCAPFHGVPPP